MLAELAKRFGRAASQYDQYAELQWQVASHCASLVDSSRAQALDIGIGTGFVARQLSNPTIYGVDLSSAMLAQAREHSRAIAVQGDMQALPFADKKINALVSSLALQWAVDAAQCLQEWRRVAAPDAQLVFATLIDGSLQQLHRSRAAMGLASNQFLTKADVLSALEASGWRALDVDQQRCDFFYPDVWQLAQSLKYIGAQTRTETSSALTTRRHWNALAKHYEKFRQSQGLPLTYEVLYVVAEN